MVNPNHRRIIQLIWVWNPYIYIVDLLYLYNNPTSIQPICRPMNLQIIHWLIPMNLLSLVHVRILQASIFPRSNGWDGEIFRLQSEIGTWSADHSSWCVACWHWIPWDFWGTNLAGKGLRITMFESTMFAWKTHELSTGPWLQVRKLWVITRG